MLNPYLVGRWNGISLWLQWTPQEPNRYDLRLRFFKPGAADWTPWTEMLRPWPIERSYHALPIHHQGWRIQAEVALHPEGDGELIWERALAATFARSVAGFRMETERKVTFPKGRVFAAQVDEFVASYELGAEMMLEAGETRDFTMNAAQLTGGCQLDRPEHFDTRPMPGIRLWNLAPSENDLMPLGGDEVVMEPASPGGPGVIAFKSHV